MANKDKCFIITLGDDTDPIRRHIEGIMGDFS